MYSPGNLFYDAQLADESSNAFSSGYFQDRPFENIHSSNVLKQQWTLSSSNNLLGPGDNILVTNGESLYTIRQGAHNYFGNGYPYVCTTNGNVATRNGQQGTKIQCSATGDEGETYSSFFVCSSGEIAPSILACNDGDDPQAEEIKQLYLTKIAAAM